MFISGFHNPTGVLDNPHARAVEIPSVWSFCADCTPLHASEGRQHVPCQHTHLRFVGSQFLPRRSPCGHSRHTTILSLPNEFSSIAWHKMCAVHNTCFRLARLRWRSQAVNMGLAGTRSLVFTIGLHRLCPVCTPSWYCFLPLAVTFLSLGSSKSIACVMC